MTPTPGSLYRDASDLHFVLQFEYYDYIFNGKSTPIPCWLTCCYTTIVNKAVIEYKQLSGLLGGKEEYYT